MRGTPGPDPRAVPADRSAAFGYDAVRLLAVAAALLVVIVILLLLEQHDGLRRWVTSVDRSVHRLAVQVENPASSAAARLLSFLGGVYVTAPLRILVGVAFIAARRWWWLAAWAGSIAVQEVVVTAMKASFDRPRPLGALEVTRQAAFPSGHASTAAVTVVALLLIVPAVRRSPWRWWLLGSLTIAAMAASRVYLRVHWPSDVLMGVLVGAAAATAVVGASAAFAERRARPRGVRLRGRMERRSRS